MTEILQGFRLSPQQRRLWRLQEGGGTPGRAQCALLLTGELDPARLERALGRLFERHEILRTSFPILPGMGTPVQRIEEGVRPAVERGQGELERLLEEDRLPERVLAPRVSLLALSGDRHVLFLGLPALSADAWSFRLLAGELARAYAGETGAGEEEDEEVLQYADFSEWQNELLDGEEAADGKAYWRGLDLGSSPRPVFPFIRRAPGAEPGLGAAAARVGPETAARLEEIAGGLGAPLPAVLATAWATLLWRISREPDVVFGRIADGRKYEDLHHGVGLFARCLPCRVQIDEGLSFRELAAALAESLREAEGWQEYFDPEETGPRPSVGFSWAELAPDSEAGGLRFSVLRQHVRPEPFDLDLACSRRVDGTAFEIRYDRALCDPAAVERLAAQWRTLLEDVARRPGVAVGELEILGEEERSQIVAGFNRTAADFPAGLCLHELVERQAARVPGAVAVVAGDVTLTYEELNRRANRLAHWLRACGVGAEVPVALAFERSPAMVVALLGTLKAGGAAVPLDLQSPSVRLTHVLADSGARVLVTQESVLGGLPPFGGLVVCLDRDADALAAEPDGDPQPVAFPESLAYITYTSGSTGKPKGVLSVHRGAVSYLDFVLREYGVGPDSVVLQVASLSFDASVRDVLGPLAAGARVVLVRDEEVRDPAALLARIRHHQVNTILSMVPTLFRALAQAVPETEESRPLPVRLLVLSGESLYLADGRSARRLFGGEVSVVNQYGPTECTMTSSSWLLTQGTEAEGERALAPIGRPIQNVRFYVVDPHGTPVPVGVAGELYIGGVGVTRGYCNRPDLSAEKFVPDPFGGSGERLYRTGDVARWLPDGTLELLGRRDRQVKIRGVRVELDEIEALLNEHPRLGEVAVVHFAEGPGVVAYCVPSERPAPNAGELRAFLRDRAPEAMVPAQFVELQALPRTRTGKVDRGALPAPGRVHPKGERRELTPLESLLAGIWEQVLGVGNVGPEDSFFDLGGHSLLAAQLVARVQDAVGVELPLRTIFEASTPAELAVVVEETKRTGQKRRAPALERISRQGPLPLSFAQQRLWFLQQLDPGTHAFNVPRAVRLRGELGERGVALLRRTVNEIVSRHENLRTTFAEAGGEPRQIIAPPRPVPLPVIDLAGIGLSGFDGAEREAERLILEMARTPFDLSTGPLLHVSLLRLGRDEHLLLFNIHHIVSDDWSMGVLVSELSALYEAFFRGEESPLPVLPVQYADYAAWQRRWLVGEPLEELLGYWRRKLAGRLPTLQLPFSRPRPAEPSYKGARQPFRLSARLTRALAGLGRAEEATLFMVLLAAFQTLLYRYTGEEDVAVGTDVANRGRVETARLIGFFVNILVLRTDLGGNPTFRELLRRVREVAFEALTHQDLPFERLVEELQPERTARPALLFQYLLVLQNPDRQRLELPGLVLEPFELDNHTSKFDLALILVETEEGLTGTWNYSTDLFDAEGIARLSSHLETLLEGIAAQPDARLSQLEYLPEGEREQEAMEKKQRKQADLAKFMSVQPKAVQLSRSSLVSMEPLTPGEKLPLVVKPAGEAVSLAGWVRGNREVLETKLLEHGAVLFRGFGLETAEQFEEVARAVCPELFSEYGDLPRDAVSGKVYTSTPYPPEHTIWFHNESSQLDSWPLRQFFFCIQPAQKGGETPLADCRRVYELLDPEVVERFDRLGVMYIRNYTPGLDVDWRDFFHTSDKAEVEAYCRRSDIEFEWKADGGLRTRKICPAVACHPRTGEKLFFNQIQAHHVSCLPPEDQESLLKLFAYEDLPRNVCYGDGTPIEGSLMQEIVRTYQQVEVTFPWQKGDLVMVDNMLTAHGRYPYVGPRKILVAMGEMVSIDTVWPAGRRRASA